MYRLMIVDDDEMLRRGLVQNVDWAGHGFEVVAQAANGKEALCKMDESMPQLIVTDIQMPIMDGYKATRAIRRFSDKKKAGIPIVAMTANAFTEDKERALESGMNDHMAKPIDMKVLMSVLEEQICGHKGL